MKKLDKNEIDLEHCEIFNSFDQMECIVSTTFLFITFLTRAKTAKVGPMGRTTSICSNHFNTLTRD